MASITISCPHLNDPAKRTIAVKGTYDLDGKGATGNVTCTVNHPTAGPITQSTPVTSAGNWCFLYSNLPETGLGQFAFIVATLKSGAGALVAMTNVPSFTIKASGTVDCGGSCP
jgi:hypothetical protein